jgi:hypothetical protein
MTRTIRYLIAVLPALTLAGCHRAGWAVPFAPVQPEGRVGVVGQVRDAESGHSIAGAGIRIYRSPPCGQPPLAEARADALGTFQVLDLAPGTYEVEAVFVGYRRMSTSIALTSGQLDTLQFALPHERVHMSEYLP